MLNIDHIAFRIKSELHDKAIEMFIKLFGYEVVDEFAPEFSDGGAQGTRCSVLSPIGCRGLERVKDIGGVKYQLPPDIFISSSIEGGSIVSRYVEKRGAGVHHLAFTVESVDKVMEEFRGSGYEFLTKEKVVCPELTQAFTKPSDLVGIIFEFLERRTASFCKGSVGVLMESTKNIN